MAETSAAQLWPIGQLLPQTPPMRLLDRVCDWDELSVITELTLTDSSPFVEAGKVRAVIALEWCAQTIAAHAGCMRRAAGKAPVWGFVVSSREMQFACDHFDVGQRIQVRACLRFSDGATSSYDCWVAAQGKKLVRGSLTVHQPPEVALLGAESEPVE